MAPAMLALLKLTADFSRAYQEESAAATRRTSPTRSMRPLTCSSARTDSPPTLRERSRSATARSWWTNIRTPTRCKTPSSGPCPGREEPLHRWRCEAEHLPLPSRRPAYFPRPLSALPARRRRGGGREREALLSKNFRSCDTVLDAANFVFRNVLSREMGELDYGEDESLHVGASYPENPTAARSSIL